MKASVEKTIETFSKSAAGSIFVKNSKDILVKCPGCGRRIFLAKNIWVFNKRSISLWPNVTHSDVKCRWHGKLSNSVWEKSQR